MKSQEQKDWEAVVECFHRLPGSAQDAASISFRHLLNTNPSMNRTEAMVKAIGFFVNLDGSPAMQGSEEYDDILHGQAIFDRLK